VTRLGHIRTQLGIITLHHRRKHDRFETRYRWLDTSGHERETVIVHAPDSAYRQYEHMRECGIVVRDFPLDGER